jgi:hypothetical protein
MSKKIIIFNFYGEKKDIYLPENYLKLLESISFQIQASIEDCKQNLIISYKDNDGDYISIDNEDDFTYFLKFAMNSNEKIDIYADLSEKSIWVLQSKLENNFEKKKSSGDILENIPISESIAIKIGEKKD